MKWKLETEREFSRERRKEGELQKKEMTPLIRAEL